jgi:Ca-activated chloride channel family protein
MQSHNEALQIVASSSVRAAPSTWFIALLSLILLGSFAYVNTANAAIGLRVIADKTPLDTTPVEVYVTVNTSGGAPVTNLTQGDFQLTEDSSAQTISGFSLPPGTGASSISVVFAMDYSTSISNSNKTAMENAVASFINTQMITGDVGAVVKFGSNLSLITPPAFTSNIVDLEAAARSPFTPPSSGTKLYDAISTSLTQLNAAPGLPSGPKAIILLTDGQDNGSTVTLNDLISQLGGSGIPVFSIAFGSSINTTVLNAIAQQSSGQVYPAASASDLQAIYSAIATRLQNEYLLTYNSAITDCNLHTLSVLVNSETQVASFRRCPAPAAAPSTSGGGGGAMHPLEWLALALLAWYRRRQQASA